MLTPEGATAILNMCIGLADEIKVLAVIGPNGEEAYRFADQRVEGATLTLTASFPADEANFEWVRREVRTVKGTVVDRAEEDGGRKPVGAIWDLEVAIDLQVPTA
jgi:hypothetical protein